MEYTVKKTKNKYEFVDENKKKHSYTGYAFIDKCGRCFIIVYGENRRDSLLEYL